MKIKCPACEKSLEVSNISRLFVVICKNCDSRFRALEAPVDYVSYRVRSLVPFIFSRESYVGDSYSSDFLDDTLIHSTICYFCGKRINVCAYVDDKNKQFFRAMPKCPHCIEWLPQEDIFRNNNKYQLENKSFSNDYTPKELLKLVKSNLISENDLIYKSGWNKSKKLNTVNMFYVGGYTYLSDTPDVYWEDDVFEFNLNQIDDANSYFEQFKNENSHVHSNYFNDFGDCMYR